MAPRELWADDFVDGVARADIVRDALCDQRADAVQSRPRRDSADRDANFAWLRRFSPNLANSKFSPGWSKARSISNAGTRIIGTAAAMAVRKPWPGGSPAAGAQLAAAPDADPGLADRGTGASGFDCQWSVANVATGMLKDLGSSLDAVVARQKATTKTAVAAPAK
jgi:hypothetical protein